ncbi:DUF2637 domain-containing protein [Rhodococcus aetherivorans]|uniref:DUF2637 domain-containing protein n=1 Tax=Rhodococcus aetherivorans TaxID=191292 RepID=UPI00045CF3F9|nr:DUF2637 domain-containing protein [Rhodococcus aetherivorans]KDE12434.1 hypothetical protein N505_0115410 [Rhodococcus aetherivorans]
MRRIDVAATILIALLAFTLSFSKLVDLASRAGYGDRMSHLWPLVVDGLAVVATMGVVRLRAQRWYAWLLLAASTTVSVVAAVAGAIFTTGPLPPIAAAAVSVVPPLCLLAAPHLAVQLMRDSRRPDDVAPMAPVESTTLAEGVAPYDVEVATDSTSPDGPAQLFAVPPASTDRRTKALELIARGLSQREVARRVGVSDTTVRRWRRQDAAA